VSTALLLADGPPVTTSSVALVLGVLGCIGSLSAALAKFIDGRRNANVEERRLGFEEMQAALIEQRAQLAEQREQITQLQKERGEDRVEMARQHQQILELTDKLEEQHRAAQGEIRRANEERDRALVAMEAMKGARTPRPATRPSRKKAT
jgi:TolA-binding protein